MTKTKNTLVLTDIELKDSMSRFNRYTRIAILLSLVLKISPDEVSDLTWSKVKTLQLNKAAIKLLNLIPRHLFSDLVFWNSASVMNNLQADVDLFLGEITLDEYRVLLANMIFVEESSKAFIRSINKAIFERG